MTNLKEKFLLDPNVVFLNHGSFGATPRPVFEAYHEWQRRLEWQPVQFLGTDLAQYLAEARAALAAYVKADPANLAYVPNATFGVNVVARSLPLGPGDAVLTTDHEYGACDNAWRFLSQERGFEYVVRSVEMPASTPTAIIDQLWQGVTPRTKVIFLSHITSPTALCLPVAEICARARAANILTVVDGAHALGQIPLDMATLGADFYTSNGHKWLCSPKGSAFLYAHPQVQHLLQPLVISWGWGPAKTFTFGSDFLDYLQWLGTDDVSAYLSVPAAIDFQAEHDWPTVRQVCHALVRQALDRINALTGLPPMYPHDAGFYHQMGIAALPHQADLPAFKNALLQRHRIEIPCIQWRDRQFIRISIQGYNGQSDVDALLHALKQELHL
ncbi:MAG: aminotransferase class V-fold PLP-dependent enzyme [Ardenticatenales bacterium]|nr:aminotransferase class V-fold PLP-dependent enzyme [Ardenticatenales bacterium]